MNSIDFTAEEVGRIAWLLVALYVSYAVLLLSAKLADNPSVTQRTAQQLRGDRPGRSSANSNGFDKGRYGDIAEPLPTICGRDRADAQPVAGLASIDYVRSRCSSVALIAMFYNNVIPNVIRHPAHCSA